MLFLVSSQQIKQNRKQNRHFRLLQNPVFKNDFKK